MLVSDGIIFPFKVHRKVPVREVYKLPDRRFAYPAGIVFLLHRTKNWQKTVTIPPKKGHLYWICELP